MTLAELSVFQIVATAACVVILSAILVLAARGRLRPRETAFWVVVLIAGQTAILWPDLTSRIARLLGIGRGADLLLYVAVVCTLAGFWMIYLRLRALRREITVLVRHLAIEKALNDSHGRVGDAGAAGETSDRSG